MKKLIVIFYFISILVFSQKYNFIKYGVKDGLNLSQISSLETFDTGELIITTFGGGFNIYDGNEFISFNPTNGLTNNNIYALAKLSDKEIWFGTEKGLSKFDGIGFTNYFKEDGLPSNLVWSLTFDKEGNLWVGTNKGLVKYENGRFIPINVELKKSQTIWSLYTLSNGNILVGTYEGLFIVDAKTNHVKNTNYFSNDKIVNTVVEKNKKEIWVGTYDGLYKIENEIVKRISDSKLTGSQIFNLFFDSDKNLWISTNEGATLYDGKNYEKLKAESGFTDYKVWKTFEDLEGNIWLGADDGLYKLTDKEFVYFDNFEDKHLDAWAVLEAGEDQYWLSSELNGLIKLENNHFKKIKLKGIDYKGVSTIYIDKKNNFWVGLERGIYRYRNSNLFSEPLRIEDNFGPIVHITEDKSGNILFSSYYYGVLRFDGKKLQELVNTTTEMPTVFRILEDSKRNLWVATGSGLMTVRGDSIYIPEGFEWTQRISIQSLLEDEFSYLWFGSYEEGLYCFDLNESSNPMFDTISVKHGLSNNAIMAMTIDDSNYLWAATNNGLNRINLKEYHSTGKKDIISYNNSDGIPGSEAFQNGILKDSRGNIILSTVDGILKFNPQNIKINRKPPTVKINKIKIIDDQFNEEILDQNEINSLHGKSLKLPYHYRNLSIYYNGICLTNNSKVRYSYKLDNGNWSAVSKNNILTLTTLDYGKHTIEIKAQNNNNVWSVNNAKLNIELIAPIWEKIWFQIFAVMMLIFLIGLFFLIRINKAKKMNKELENRIRERLQYESKLLKQEKELRAAKEKAENSDRLKTEFLSQMSHEIRTPINTILSYTNLIQENIYEKIDEQLLEGFSVIERSSQRLIRTIDSILNMSQIQTGSLEINKKKIELLKIINSIYDEFKNIAYKKGLKFDLISNVNECYVEVDQYTTTQLIANLVDNSIKYTKEGTVSIKLEEYSDKEVAVEISDTGIGMSEQFQKQLFEPFLQEEHGYTRSFDGAGLGLALVLKYAKLNQIEISFKSKKDEGTTFICILKRVTPN